ncbi:MAG: phosphate ABC transporter substrate-binding protein PstS [Gemmatimonadales bacterium]
MRVVRQLGCLGLGSILLLAGCGGGEGGKPASGPALTGAGATFPNPIYAKWFDTYASRTGIQINYQSIGSGGGIRQFVEGTVDFGATDGPMTDEQIAQVQGNVLHLPTVLGAVVVTYNLPSLGETPLTLDGPVLADIYMGRIARWNDRRLAALNPGVALPDRELIVVHRSDGSGTSYIWTDYLSKVSQPWADTVGRGTAVQWPIGLGGKGNEGVTQQVKQVEGTVGYVELIYALSNGLPVARIRNLAGNPVAPSLESTTAAAAAVDLPADTDFRISITNPPGAQAYPIASFTWLLIRRQNPDTAKARVIRDFLTWMVSDSAQAMAADLHYAPLPESVRALVRERIGRL